MDNEEVSSYFRQVVRDCITELKKVGYSYCFYDDQVRCIQERLPGTESVEVDGMFKLTYSGEVPKRGKRGRPKNEQ